MRWRNQQRKHTASNGYAFLDHPLDLSWIPVPAQQGSMGIGPSATAPATALQLVDSTIATLEASLGLQPGAVLAPARGVGGNTKRPTKGKEGAKKGGSRKAGKGKYNDHCPLGEESSGEYHEFRILDGLFPAFAGYLVLHNKHANRSMPIVSQQFGQILPVRAAHCLCDQPKACDATMGYHLVYQFLLRTPASRYYSFSFAC